METENVSIITRKEAKRIGRELILAANQKRKDEIGKKLVSLVGDLQRYKKSLEDYIKVHQEKLSDVTRKLDCIESGNFTVNENVEIIFSEKI